MLTLVTAIPAQKRLSDNSHTGAPADGDMGAPADDDMDDTHEPVTDDYVAPADVDDVPPPTQVRFIYIAVSSVTSEVLEVLDGTTIL